MQIGMQRNLLMNMADHGTWVAGYDEDSGKGEALNLESEAQTTQEAKL